MRGLEVFLDQTPGETRGVVVRDGRARRLLIHRDTDPPHVRLCARWIGRVSRIDAGLRGAFVEAGPSGVEGFLPLRRDVRLMAGQAVEVQVTSEPRDVKLATLSLIGRAEGPPRLIAPGPKAPQILAGLAPGAPMVTGAPALRASLDAEAEARETTSVLADVSVAVERTRGMIAVDIDHAPAPGRDPGRDKARANRVGLAEAARMIELKGLGGLVAIDLVGTGLNGDAIAAAARSAFPDPAVVVGPVNRFGVLMLSLPWTTTPVEERLQDAEAQAIGVVRRLALALAVNMAAPYLTLRCSAERLARVQALAARLGPRARVKADPALSLGQSRIDEG